MNIRACFLAICIAVIPFTDSHGITYGESDGVDHPYVGLILFWAKGVPQFPCSGTLIAPRVVLTAGHCAFGMDEAWVWFEDVVPQTAPPLRTGTPYSHQDFDMSVFDFPDFYRNLTSGTNTNDIGVVILDSEVLLPYADLPALDLLDSLSSRGGRQLFTIVGYGLDALTPLSPLVPPQLIKRRKATSMLVNLRNALTSDYNLQTSGHPGRGLGDGGSCKGDSGGPVLLGDTDIVVGIVSFGLDGLCRGPGFSYRTDIESSQDFVDDQLW